MDRERGTITLPNTGGQLDTAPCWHRATLCQAAQRGRVQQGVVYHRRQADALGVSAARHHLHIGCLMRLRDEDAGAGSGRQVRPDARSLS
jgi:hypothetical protein